MPVRDLSYHLLNKKLFPPQPDGFRQDILLVIVNKNETKNKDKVILVQQGNGFWNLPKEGMETTRPGEEIIWSITKALETELGFRGRSAMDSRPKIQLRAIIFQFTHQVYDRDRAADEAKKGRPNKGKVYHAIFIEYRGPDDFARIVNEEIIDYRWVNNNDALELLNTNMKLVEKGVIRSGSSVTFNIRLWKDVMEAYEVVNKTLKINQSQQELF